MRKAWIRRLARAGGEMGQTAMALCVLIVFLMVAIPVAAEYQAQGQSYNTADNGYVIQATQAAEAGIADYQNHLAANSLYAASGVGEPGYCSSWFATTADTCGTGGSNTIPGSSNPAFVNAFDGTSKAGGPANANLTCTSGLSTYTDWVSVSGDSGYQYMVDSSTDTNPNAQSTVYLYVTGRAGTSHDYFCQTMKTSIEVQTQSTPITPPTNNTGCENGEENGQPCEGTTSNGALTLTATLVGGTGGNGGNAGLWPHESGGKGGLGEEIQMTVSLPAGTKGEFSVIAGNEGGVGGSQSAASHGGAGYAAGGNGGHEGGAGGGGTALCIDSGSASTPCNSSTGVCSTSITTASALQSAAPCVLAVAAGGGGGGQGNCLDTGPNAGHGQTNNQSGTSGGNGSGVDLGFLGGSPGGTGGGGATTSGPGSGGAGDYVEIRGFRITGITPAGATGGGPAPGAGGAGATVSGGDSGGGGGGYFGGGGGGTGIACDTGAAGGAGSSWGWADSSFSPTITYSEAPVGTTNGWGTANPTPAAYTYSDTPSYPCGGEGSSCSVCNTSEALTEPSVSVGSSLNEISLGTSTGTSGIYDGLSGAGGGGGGAWEVFVAGISPGANGAYGGAGGEVGGGGGVVSGKDAYNGQPVDWDLTYSRTAPSFSYIIGCGGGGGQSGGSANCTEGKGLESGGDVNKSGDTGGGCGAGASAVCLGTSCSFSTPGCNSNTSYSGASCILAVGGGGGGGAEGGSNAGDSDSGGPGWGGMSASCGYGQSNEQSYSLGTSGYGPPSAVSTSNGNGTAGSCYDGSSQYAGGGGTSSGGGGGGSCGGTSSGTSYYNTGGEQTAGSSQTDTSDGGGGGGGYNGGGGGCGGSGGGYGGGGGSSWVDTATSIGCGTGCSVSYDSTNSSTAAYGQGIAGGNGASDPGDGCIPWYQFGSGECYSKGNAGANGTINLNWQVATPVLSPTVTTGSCIPEQVTLIGGTAVSVPGPNGTSTMVTLPVGEVDLSSIGAAGGQISTSGEAYGYGADVTLPVLVSSGEKITLDLGCQGFGGIGGAGIETITSGTYTDNGGNSGTVTGCDSDPASAGSACQTGQGQGGGGGGASAICFGSTCTSSTPLCTSISGTNCMFVLAGGGGGGGAPTTNDCSAKATGGGGGYGTNGVDGGESTSGTSVFAYGANAGDVSGTSGAGGASGSGSGTEGTSTYTVGTVTETVGAGGGGGFYGGGGATINGDCGGGGAASWWVSGDNGVGTVANQPTGGFSYTEVVADMYAARTTTPDDTAWN